MPYQLYTKVLAVLNQKSKFMPKTTKKLTAKTKSKTTKGSILSSEVTSPKANPPKPAKKLYHLAIAALVIIAFIAGWFAFRTIFPKIVKAPTTEPTKREITPSEESLELEIKEEKPIESFEDVDEALEDLGSRVGEIGELGSDLETPNIDLDNLGF